MFFAALSALFTLLALTLVTYNDRQAGLHREGNRLYSSDAIRVELPLSEALAVFDTGAQNARAFTNVSEDGSVRAFTAQPRASLGFPIHSGRGFVAGEVGTALVGADVVTLTRDSLEIVRIDDREYRVVGVLGRSPQSLLSGDVLLYDPDYFVTAPDQAVVLDAPGGLARAAAAFEDEWAPASLTATSGRTNIDFVSPALLALGGTLVVVGWAFTGQFVGASVRPRARILHVLGAPRHRRLLTRFGPIVLVSAATALLAGVALLLLGVDQAPLLTAAILLVQAVTVASFSALTPRATRGGDDA
ncbi:hypothetical protein D9V32_11765 [Mycetocola tolaasinivorans]|uniref:ABC transporter permease n=1 Tax=Mycetocola tolaasinivorans TaxID=76635 RepID=A0A3L7A382_9MICO|nr:hypothetical protein D9V32_11765 [Mycetocola tolaasinivorans]